MRADKLLAHLAPDAEQGYGPAHLARARQIAEHLSDATREELNQCEHHLQYASKQREDPEIEGLMGLVLFEKGRHEDALDRLKRAAETLPRFQIARAERLLELGRTDQSRRLSEDAIKSYREMLAAEPANVPVRIAIAENHLLLGNLPDVETALTENAACIHDSQMQDAIARLYTELWRRHDSESETSTARIGLLTRALEFAPGHPAILKELARVASNGHPLADQARKILANLTGESPAPVHLVIGAAAARTGDMQGATLHFEQAYRLRPDLEESVVGLALIYARSEPARLEEAMRTLESAAAFQPRLSAKLLAARGEIRARAGKWSAALADLEDARYAGDDSMEVRGLLASVYEHLGDPELAVALHGGQRHNPPIRARPPRAQQVTLASRSQPAAPVNEKARFDPTESAKIAVDADDHRVVASISPGQLPMARLLVRHSRVSRSAGEIAINVP